MMDEDKTLPPEYDEIPTLALRPSSRNKLSLCLDGETIVECQSGFVADYRGLAEIIGFDLREIQAFERQKSPTQELLKEWDKMSSGTVGALWRNLKVLERWDCITDCYKPVMNDCACYLRKQEKEKEMPLQDQAVSQSLDEFDDMDVDEKKILTVQDVQIGTPQFYDAFVCYNVDSSEDLKFVKKMLKELECPPHNFRFFVPWRDDIPGSAEHVVSAALIQQRCKRMIIVMSPSYARSKACDFQTKYAHSLAPGSRSKKLIPVLISQIPIPEILRFVTICDFTKVDLLPWVWTRLAAAVKAPIEIADVKLEKNYDTNSLNDMKMTVNGKLSTWSPSEDSSSSSNNSASASSRSLSVALSSLPSSSC